MLFGLRAVWVCIAMTVLLSSCGRAPAIAPLSDEDISQSEAIKQTKYMRSGYYTDTYPSVDISSIVSLPVYTYAGYTDAEIENKKDAFVQLLGVAAENNVLANINSVNVSLDGEALRESLILSELFSTAVAEINYSYDSDNDSIELDESCCAEMVEACRSLADIFGYDVYSSFSVRREQIHNDGGVADADFSILLSFSDIPIETERDKLLYYYDLIDRLDCRIQITNGQFRQLTLVKYDTDFLVEVGEYDVLSANEAFEQGVDANNEVYIVYLVGNAYIYPIYSKQDYYSVGDLDECEYAMCLK